MLAPLLLPTPPVLLYKSYLPILCLSFPAAILLPSLPTTLLLSNFENLGKISQAPITQAGFPLIRGTNQVRSFNIFKTQHSQDTAQALQYRGLWLITLRLAGSLLNLGRLLERRAIFPCVLPFA